jgi:hypothetical protein
VSEFAKGLPGVCQGLDPHRWPVFIGLPRVPRVPRVLAGGWGRGGGALRIADCGFGDRPFDVQCSMFSVRCSVFDVLVHPPSSPFAQSVVYGAAWENGLKSARPASKMAHDPWRQHPFRVTGRLLWLGAELALAPLIFALRCLPFPRRATRASWVHICSRRILRIFRLQPAVHGPIPASVKGSPTFAYFHYPFAFRSRFPREPAPPIFNRLAIQLKVIVVSGPDHIM